MVDLNKKELENIQGGGISLGAALLIGGAVVFIIGVIDGQIKLK